MLLLNSLYCVFAMPSHELIHLVPIDFVSPKVAASNAMMELHASLIRRLQKRSYHPGDMLDLVYTVTCTPARYIHTKDVWRALTACRLARGFLCNVLVFLPITLAVLRVSSYRWRGRCNQLIYCLNEHAFLHIFLLYCDHRLTWRVPDSFWNSTVHRYWSKRTLDL